jgi:hypothetical protein
LDKRIDREKLFAYFFPANGKYIGTLLVDLKGYPNVLTATGTPSAAAGGRKWLHGRKDQGAVMPELFRNRVPLEQLSAKSASESRDSAFPVNDLAT